MAHLLDEAEHYCAATGIALSTLGVRVLGNSRYFDRLKRRIVRDHEDAAKLRDFMARNPPTNSEDAA